MTIEELIKDKKQLESSVFNLCNDFQKKTGLAIQGLSLITVEENIDFKTTSLVKVSAIVEI